jgi:hypothetical protein
MSQEGKVDEVVAHHASAMNTLRARQKEYGLFREGAQRVQAFKSIARDSHNWERMSDAQQESLDLIFTKIGRILNGNPDNPDSWHDIAGYATLVEKELRGEIL